LATKKNREASASVRIDIAHHRYRIIAGQREGTCHAIAYLANRKIESLNGETVESAVDALKGVLDERMVRLRRDRVDGVPSAQEFCEALMALDEAGLKPVITLLAVHSRRPDAAATMEELARLAGRDESTIATDYMRFGRKLGAFLDFVPEVNGYDRTLAPMLTFTVPETQPKKAGPVLRLRSEMLDAFRTLDRKDEPSRV
jgi:hypothetical protein